MSAPLIEPNIISVALDVPLDRTFDYLNAGFQVQVGQRVVVPFAGRQLVGVVLAIHQQSEVPVDKLKTVMHVFDDIALDTQTYQLLKFCAAYYHYPLGQMLISALPLRLRQIKPAVSRKTFVYSYAKPIPPERIQKRQIVLQRIVTALTVQHSLSEQQLSEVATGWRKWVQPLIEEGFIQAQEVIAIRPSVPSSHQAPTLNAEQQHATQAVLAAPKQFKPWLLYGITGSGKTEVYIQLLANILAEEHAQALVLVPEINLTPQLEARFRSRLSQYPLVTLHSNLSESERLQNWLAAKSGAAKIVIGTRLSVFTPMPHLKLMVMDEEHDGSYKQQEGMRYHARDVAMVRAKQLNIPIVLGSATPSLETWYNATTSNTTTQPEKKQSYGLLTLTQRAVTQAQLPKIFCIDSAKSPLENGLSPLLIEAMRKRLARGEQSLLFINRRGYAPVLHCSACLWHSSCTRCSAKLVVHLSQRRLKCHHCGHEQKIPLQCPSCGNADLKPIGQATQRLSQTLESLFPTARIARVDRDSMRSKDALTTLLSKVHAGEIDILVGTQMLAKGHDFPNLTLVGVIDTDTALYSPDFRASERLFSQLMQVSGRAGRAAVAGEVLIQTAFPQHDLFHALRAQDYAAYANTLLQERIAMQLPPSRFFVLLKAEASDYQQVQQFLNSAAAYARQHANEVTLYDPVRPQMERLKGLERAYVLLQAEKRQTLQRLLHVWVPQLRAHPLSSKIRWALDIDPLEF
ncbi:primosomal protein N' [Methylotenera sp. N17]|uniref:primosomal protein N' n=1 Tax=Methylotenera sp. N17 TaxID=1502761 RepID=UPI0006491B91|nr:primosomal protein N' [Methylotenera sp. N17]